MNQKIPFHELSSRIAAITGISEDSAGVFVKNFFEILSDELIKGESVKIKGLGEFSLSNNDGEKNVEFHADKDLSETINAPFSIFEPVELNEQATVEILAIDGNKDENENGDSIDCNDQNSGTKTTDDNPDDNSEAQSIQPVENLPAEPASETDAPVIQADETAPNQDIPDSTTIEPAATIESVAEITTEQEAAHTPSVLPLEDEPEVFVNQEATGSSNGNFWLGLTIGVIVGIAIGACGVYLAIDKLFPGGHPQQSVVAETVIEEDASAISETSVASDMSAPVTADTITPAKDSIPANSVNVNQQKTAEIPMQRRDTVKRGYLIHDMAKKFFGSKDFWVYIYEENKSKIGNPNNMQPGVVLNIPDPQKYGIIPGDPESLKKARHKAGEILAKYPK